MSTWTPPPPDAISASMPSLIEDIHSFANVNEVYSTNLHLDWDIDWNAKCIRGSVTHTLHVVQGGVAHVTFDTSHLDLGQVTVDGELATDVVLGDRKSRLGQPLTIGLGERHAGDTVCVTINYSTTSECTALGWLSREQTKAKTAPFLYSQCQAIHCRSLLPCMDTPSRKVTYTATVRSPTMVLMSALPDKEAKDGVYRFEQPVAIPTYLIAIVSGDLEFRSLGPRTGIYAEPPDADAVQWEFEADAERFLEHAERTIFPYVWTRYDSVVLPPSFPYGGMENANLTTLTPSLVCGDRSSTDVLLHELCHSWSGNLISCANWQSFWLNEGWTVYLERLLLQRVYGDGDKGAAHRGFSYIIGARALRESLEGFSKIPRFQRLIPEFLDGEDPDDAFSSIPYDKGANFLLHIERVVGGLDVFLPYVRAYFFAFQGRSVTTEDWKNHLFAYYAGSEEITERLKSIDFDAWLHGEGLELPVKMEYDTSLAEAAFGLAARWERRIEGKDEKFSAADIEGWTAGQVVVFLERLHSGAAVPAAVAEELDEAYALNTAQNTEIRMRFYQVALEDKEGKYAPYAAEWVKTQGRMKYCRAIYKALVRVEPELARRTFKENRSFYHPIAASLIEKSLTQDIAVPLKHMAVGVIGSTGTGKSQLAVELAEFVRSRDIGGYSDAEVISADSMQTYEGLDVITNKADADEMHGVPHHLLSFLPPGDEYDITQFISDATRLSDEFHQRSERALPIFAGGTTYYLQHFLFPGRLVSADEGEPDKESLERLARRISALPAEQQALWSTLDAEVQSNAAPPANADQMWGLLKVLDPESAARWHYNDHRKVLRSLRILRDTGRSQSEWAALQGERDEKPRDSPRRLLFWVWSEREALRQRLDARIGRMIERGLLDEIRSLKHIAAGLPDQGKDYTRGIFQAIGYKEFDAYLDHVASGGEKDQEQKLFDAAIDAMQVGTRRYAKRQTSWIKNQLIPAIAAAQARGEEAHIYLLDATDPGKWDENVRKPALAILESFLTGSAMPDAFQQSEAAASELAALRSEKTSEIVHTRIKSNRKYACPECTSDESKPFLVAENEREKHLQSRTHRYAVKRRTRNKWIAEKKEAGESVRRARAEANEAKHAVMHDQVE
ncbi:leukotriene-A4 hydrolase [Malassezia cuniculi]|uniref:Leukotriene-A4 hydrolase n=1 Tax=Malassezia cuniculi TaxID=948313 RepID=A0AAF0EUP5_9BASI|nr:leukotriene-A4 hydrolase [Malassezia cuniculi]